MEIKHLQTPSPPVVSLYVILFILLTLYFNTEDAEMMTGQI